MGCAIMRKVDIGSPCSHRQSSCSVRRYCLAVLENDFGVDFHPKYRLC